MGPEPGLFGLLESGGDGGVLRRFFPSPYPSDTRTDPVNRPSTSILNLPVLCLRALGTCTLSLGANLGVSFNLEEQVTSPF
jgi:hypothetical protein